MVCVLITYWNTHTLIYISVQSYGKKTNRGVLVFFSVERNTNDAICIFDFAIKCICLMFIDLYKNKKFVRKVKKKGTISSVMVS